MNTTLGLLLALSFVVSLAALGVLIWAIANRQIGAGKTEASSIFLAGESGHLDDPPPALARTASTPSAPAWTGPDARWCRR